MTTCHFVLSTSRLQNPFSHNSVEGSPAYIFGLRKDLFQSWNQQKRHISNQLYIVHLGLNHSAKKRKRNLGYLRIKGAYALVCTIITLLTHSQLWCVVPEKSIPPPLRCVVPEISILPPLRYDGQGKFREEEGVGGGGPKGGRFLSSGSE